MKKDKQQKLFDSPEWWEEHWQDMPEYHSDDLMPYHTILLHFKDRKSMEDFQSLVKQPIKKTTKYAWYPKIEIQKMKNFLCIDSDES